ALSVTPWARTIIVTTRGIAMPKTRIDPSSATVGTACSGLFHTPHPTRLPSPRSTAASPLGPPLAPRLSVHTPGALRPPSLGLLASCAEARPGSLHLFTLRRTEGQSVSLRSVQ